MRFKIQSPNIFFLLSFFCFSIQFLLPLFGSGFNIFIRYHISNVPYWNFLKIESHYLFYAYAYAYIFIFLAFIIFKILNSFFNKKYKKKYFYNNINFKKSYNKLLIVSYLSILLFAFLIKNTDGFFQQIIFNSKFFLYICILFIIFNFNKNLKQFYFHLIVFFLLISLSSILAFKGSIIDLFYVFLMFLFISTLYRIKLATIVVSIFIFSINVFLSNVLKNKARMNYDLPLPKAVLVETYSSTMKNSLENNLSYSEIMDVEALNFVPTGVIFNPLIAKNSEYKYINKIINLLNTVYNRFLKINEFAWVIKLHNGATFNNIIEKDISLKTNIKKEYKNGSSYNAIFTKIIPRFIFDLKPKENSGNKFGKEYLMLPNHDAVTSVNLHILIESYINFGVTGILILSSMFGFLIFFCYTLILKQENLFMAIFYSVPILIFSISSESNLSSSLGGLLYQYLLLFTITLVFKLNLVTKYFQFALRKLLN